MRLQTVRNFIVVMHYNHYKYIINNNSVTLNTISNNFSDLCPYRQNKSID